MSETADILNKIVCRKREEIAIRQKRVPLAELYTRLPSAPTVRGFRRALAEQTNQGRAAVIAEIKKASPSKGIFRSDYKPAEIAQNYQIHGATCLSVLTDKDFFQGSEVDLQQARQACTLPVLRKDFIIDHYQIYEARSIGADCILLIASILTIEELVALYSTATELGMDVLLEIHDASEIEHAVAANASLIGVNNRNLRTFSTDLQTTLTLLPLLPKHALIVTESGISEPEHVEIMQHHQVNAFLVGEALMKTENPGKAMCQLFDWECNNHIRS